jgi:uncharacterized protein (DUF433 family)
MAMNLDPREFPIYGIGEAAGYLHIPSATLRSWTVGRTYDTREGPAEFEPLGRLSEPGTARLSFSNLVEAHVLRALRTRHQVSIRAVRQALSYAEAELAVERLLLSEELLTNAGDIFLERYGELINLSKSGQIAVRRLLEAHLERVERGQERLPSRLFPFLTGDLATSSRLIVIDPTVSYGRPTIVSKGITTEAVVGRIDASEDVESLAEDYDLTSDEIEAAVLYERAA